jgi:CheY-like chemotaxis protein
MTRALVIDDDDIARELIVSILQEGGYETFDLPSPIGATQTIIGERIDLVILDLIMPGLSGDKLAKMLRDNPRLSRLSIVLVSSSSIAELRAIAASVRADAVISKTDIRRNLLPTLASLRASPGKRRTTA